MDASKTLIILGASGDLTERLLLPGLGSLIAAGTDSDREVVGGLQIIGSGRSERSSEQWQATVRSAFEEAGASAEGIAAIVERAEYVVADPTTEEGIGALLSAAAATPVLYFALPPSVVVKTVETLADVELPAGTVLAMEKPFGSDQRSAAALNAKLAAILPEEQIHRVDHFLGLPTVQNLVGLRFANRIFEPVWNAENIARVQITYDETLGLEGRAAYYDSAGALVDMLQSHLLQVLAVFAMERPDAIDEYRFREAIATVLGSTALWNGEPALAGSPSASRRARYTAGEIDGKKLPSYVDEEGVDPSKGTETLAELAVGIDTDRWRGVPFILRSGKAIGRPSRTIEVILKPVPAVPDGLRGFAKPERLIIGVNPPTVTLEITTSGEDQPFGLESSELETELQTAKVTEYGEVLRGILGSDPTLAIRGDVAEQCWRIVGPALESWRNGDVPLDEYPAGSNGPDSWR